MAKQAEKHEFQAEVNQVLSLVVNSLYTHKEIFLRELISNASDALDQISFRSITEPEVLGDEKDLRIDIVADRDGEVLTISDTGVGMTHDQMVQNLGTIAHSGTRKLVESLSGDEGKDLSLIGQFGVGFYSAFLVADKVTVVSRAAGSDEAWRWESEAHGEFTVEPTERDRRGTDVILKLRDGEDQFVRDWAVRELVRKYSDFVRHPIRIQVENERPVGDETDEEGRPKETETVREWEQINRAEALWTRPKADVTKEQYEEFYKHLTHDFAPPLAYTHFHVEGLQEFTGLLFVPSQPPLFEMPRSKSPGIRLFVKRVFIMEDCEELLPEWLRFVRGLVDSEDLPLNVSREFLQKDRISAGIKKQVVSKMLALLEEMADEGETVEEPDEEGGEEVRRNRYDEFWAQYGSVLKEGVHHAPEHRDRIAALLRYTSSADVGLTSLAGYVQRMPDEQEAIYYVTAENTESAAGSPHIEALRKHGFEVLYLVDPVDEWVVEALREYDGRKLVSASKGALDLPSEEGADEEREKKAEEFGGLLGRMKEILDEKVKEVRLTDRLTDSPACLVVDEHGMSPHVERLLRANRQAVPEQKRILEVNAAHPVVERLKALAEAGEDTERVGDWTWLLYDQALVAEGSPPSDPVRFARQITSLLERSSG